MASLQARHQKSCELEKPWTAVDRARPDGCTCDPGPTYYLVASLGKGGRRSLGRSFTDAKKALTKTQHDQDRGDWRPVKDITFEAWADEWFGSLRRPNANTLRSYVSTIDYAKRAFGSKKVRSITVLDIERFLQGMRREVKLENGNSEQQPISASTQLKHLRVLSACFKVAVRRGYASTNPVALLDDSQKPQKTKTESAYFTDDELAPLLSQIDGWDRALVQLALLTGMRAGELIALKWGNVNLGEASIDVREAYTDGLGVSEPKSDTSKRKVRLTSAAVTLLGTLWGEHITDDDLVFPPRFESTDGYRRGYDLPRMLYPAMERAGIDRVGPTGAERTFHSLRHTYARLALESGASIEWLSRQLGHSSTAVTQNVYGHWSDDAAQREIARLEEAGAFGVIAL